MNRNMVVSGLIAAALHGVVLALPGGPAPKPVEKEKFNRDEFILIKPIEPPEIDLTRTADPNERRREAPMPVGPDEIVAKTAVFETPVGPTVIVSVTGVRELSSLPIGLPGGTVDGIQGLMRGIDLDNEPRTRAQVAPHYPHEAKIKGLTGEVWVEFVVDESGRVLNPRVMRSSDSVFDEPTLRAVSKWRFEPGRHLGQVVRFRMAVPVVFNLND